MCVSPPFLSRVHTARVPLEICGDDGEPRRSMAWCRYVAAADNHHAGIPGERGSDLTLETHNVNKSSGNQVSEGGSPREDGSRKADAGRFDGNKEHGKQRRRRRLQATLPTRTTDAANMNNLLSEFWDASNRKQLQQRYERWGPQRRGGGHRQASESRKRSRRDARRPESEGWEPSEGGIDLSLSEDWESSMMQKNAALSRTQEASRPSQTTRARVFREPALFPHGERRGMSKRTGEHGFGPSSEVRVGVDAPEAAAGARVDAQIQIRQRRGLEENTVPARSSVEGEGANGDKEAETSHQTGSVGKGEDEYPMEMKACFAWIPEDPCEQVDHPGVIGEAARYWVWASMGGVWRPGGPAAESMEEVKKAFACV